MDLADALDRAPTGERPRFDLAAGALVGGRCADCGATAWPARAVCHRCGGADVRLGTFARAGTLVSCTLVMVPRPGLEAPYMLGQVRLDDGPVVFGQIIGLDDAEAVPCPVTVQVSADRYWFTPAGLQEPTGERQDETRVSSDETGG
ncbi:hypothetical protein C1I98_00390 [Spongiactinospora gelatinilytica]|uniref:DUF35 domain-containing protein n=1 Tax=Spongiactinospora gelatinilytica TaxID=2666298 RepID=A0A2W2J662_9ACTN|nr:zinc ribbon domain-containing protein [Spongiactinospora gelatinilytica]PZG56994.1 hypothetical protein C1I98_00390 [Spongiactinospora gelatinilytica]